MSCVEAQRIAIIEYANIENGWGTSVSFNIDSCPFGVFVCCAHRRVAALWRDR
jgi:hypothetical protein